MRGYLARRLVAAVGVLLGISMLVFAIVRLVPGDVVDVMLGTRNVTAEARAALRAQLGLDAPLPVQYFRFLTNAVQGEFGVSLTNKMPVARAIAEQLPHTGALAAAALVVALGIGFPLGVLAALKPGSWADTLAMAVSVTGLSIPTFWLGLMLILFFAVDLGWFPTGGAGTFWHLALPALTLATFTSASIARLLRSSVIDVLREDYVRTARAKGLLPRTVMVWHIARNALIPVATMVGILAGELLGGSVITETVFAWPGVGRVIIQAIEVKDFPVVQAGIMLIAVTFVSINFLVDLLYGVLDPRIRLR